MRGIEEDEFVDGLKELINLERELETSKQSLSYRHDFNLYDAFKVFDPSNYGNVGVHDLMDGFAAYHVTLGFDEAELIMRRYDNNGDGRLNYTEFISMFLPMDRPTSDILQARRANIGHFPRSEIFAGVTKDMFASLLRQHINVESYAERIRQRLASRPFFRQSEAFMALDNRSHNFITKDEFGDMLAHHRFFATENELSTLIDRFDKNKDGRVTYSEFVQEITPHSPSKF